MPRLMLYTLSQLLTKLEQAQAFPQESSTAQRKEVINEALESIIVSGRWDGTEVEIQVQVGNDGILTLPRELASCKGVRVDGNVRNLASVWYTYLQNTSDLSQFSTNIRDLGDRRPVFANMRPTDIPGVPYEPAQLRIACPGETSPPYVEVHGLDEGNQDVWVNTQHGALLAFNEPKQIGSPNIMVVKEVIIPITDQPAILYACYGDNTEQQIGYYEPGETLPMYRAYLIQEALSGSTSNSTTAVNALCQRRHVDLIADNDVCQISNFKAILFAVRSIHWSREGDEARQVADFNECISLLNSELRRLKPPSEVGAMRVSASGCCAVGLYSRR